VSKRREQLLRDFLRQVWDNGDVQAAGDFLAARYTIHHDPGDPWDGQTLDLAAFQNRLIQSRAAFPDQRFAIQQIFANEEGIAATWLWEGTHEQEIAGFTATGQRVTMFGATAYFFNTENRLTGHWQISDRLGVFRQLQHQRRT